MKSNFRLSAFDSFPDSLGTKEQTSKVNTRCGLMLVSFLQISEKVEFHEKQIPKSTKTAPVQEKEKS